MSAADGLSAEEKRALLEKLLRQRGAREAPLGLVPVPREGRLLPSFGQERIWFFDQLLPGNPAYNSAACIRFEGELDLKALHRALTWTVGRHEALRASIGVEQGSPVIRLSKAALVDLPLEDLCGLEQAAQEPWVQRRFLEEWAVPFDLGRGPLLRARLLRTAPERHVLLLVVHHIAIDAWSMGVVLEELDDLYNAARSEQECPLPAAALQYADFAQWQRDWMSGDRLAQEVRYWKTVLEGAPTLLQLPNDKERSAQPSFSTGRQSLRIGQATTRSLQALARAEGKTLFMVLLGAFEALLYRYSGQVDFLVGTQVANRTVVGSERMVGFFVNTVVLRATIDPKERFTDHLERVGNRLLDAFAHQGLPFEKVVEAVSPERTLSHSVLVQAMFNLGNRELPALRFDGLQTRLELDAGTTDVDLNVYAAESPEGLELDFGYQKDLFEDGTIRRMADHFGALLEGLVADPSCKVAKLPMLAAAERAALLEEGARPLPLEDPSALLADLIERQVERTPEAPALVFGDEVLSYRELNERANRLAHLLLTLGVGPERVVGVLLERSTAMVVTLLAILKAQGAYLPLDPSYPQARLRFMLEDSATQVVVTSAGVGEGVEAVGTKVVRLDLCGERLAAQPSTNPIRRCLPESLAYVLYTSGSTGRPKGVLLAHRQVVNFFGAMDERLGTAPGTWAAVTSMSFDISVLELLWTLSRGYKVIVQGTAGSTASSGYLPLSELLVKHQATHLQCTPSLARALTLEPGFPGCMASVRVLLLGGEALPPSLFEQLRPVVQGEIHNMYGPTETTIWSSSHCVSADGILSLGRALGNNRLYVLDSLGQLQPRGVAGELYIGGDGVARGYHGRPELAAERFVPDPFSPQPGARMYRTGDLVRWSGTGALEFLGRLDYQVKVRGFRIELGEIEAALGRLPGVKEAAATAEVKENGDARLLGYLVAHPGTQVDPADCRRRLRESLPDYMVPAVVVMLPLMPLTSNGKLDRKALLAPAALEEGSLEPLAEPRSDLERTLVREWAAILGLSAVGIHDDFFELGGDSLLAARLTYNLREAVGSEVTTLMIFQAPTVAALAGAIGRAGEKDDLLVSSASDSEVDELLAELLAQNRGG